MNNNNENNNNEDLEEFQNLRCLRIQENLHKKYFLYYKQYPKANSEKFPQNQSAIFFYFSDDLDEKFFYLYISLVGQIENVSLGQFFNKRGSKAKRKIVHFAIVKFLEEEALISLLDQKETQTKINKYLEDRKHRTIDLDYDPLKGIDDIEEGEADADGFVEVKRVNTKNYFSKGDVSFKVKKEMDENDEDYDLYAKKKKKKQGIDDTYWNFQVLDKKRQSKFNLIII